MRYLPRAAALDELRDLTRRVGKPVPAIGIPRRLQAALLHHWGSLRVARRAAGLAAFPPRRRWSLELVVAEIRRLHKQGVRIVIPDLCEAGREDLVCAIKVYAGGMPRARRLARVPEPRRRWSEREPWDEARVSEEILELHGAGKSVAFSKAPSKLVQAGIRLFGSWRAAIEAAGLDYRSVRLAAEYTEAELLADLRRLAARRPGMTVTDLWGTKLGRAVARRFSSIQEAARRAGLRDWPARRALPALSRAATIAALRARDRAGKPMAREAIARDDTCLVQSAYRHFGTMLDAFAAAGVEPDTVRESWTKENIVRHLMARRARGEPLNAKAVAGEHPALYEAARRLFGSYYAIASRYGASSKRRTWSKETTVAELRRIARQNGGVVRAADLPGAAFKACERLFGGFPAARRAAGVSPPRRRWPPERVLEELRAAERVRERTGRLGGALSPTVRSLARRFFGSIGAARRAARGDAPAQR